MCGPPPPRSGAADLAGERTLTTADRLSRPPAATRPRRSHPPPVRRGPRGRPPVGAPRRARRSATARAPRRSRSAARQQRRSEQADRPRPPGLEAVQGLELRQQQPGGRPAGRARRAGSPASDARSPRRPTTGRGRRRRSPVVHGLLMPLNWLYRRVAESATLVPASNQALQLLLHAHHPRRAHRDHARGRARRARDARAGPLVDAMARRRHRYQRDRRARGVRLVAVGSAVDPGRGDRARLPARRPAAVAGEPVEQRPRARGRGQRHRGTAVVVAVTAGSVQLVPQLLPVGVDVIVPVPDLLTLRPPSRRRSRPPTRLTWGSRVSRSTRPGRRPRCPCASLQ